MKTAATKSHTNQLPKDECGAIANADLVSFLLSGEPVMVAGEANGLVVVLDQIVIDVVPSE